MKKLAWSVVVVAGVIGCGAEVVTGSAGAGGGGVGSTGAGASGPGPTSTGTGGPTDPCPAVQPQGGACSAPEGFRCSYGDSVRPDCRSAVVCTSGQWLATISICAQPLLCPKPSAPPAGADCTGDEGAFCAYGDTVCGCSACLGGPCMVPPILWQCNGPPTGPGCPAVVPNDGTPCNTPGAECSYGFICTSAGALAICQGGLWLWSSMVACEG
jgi:hypothetical protein